MIESIDGHGVIKNDQILAFVAAHKPGQSVTLRVLRSGAVRTLRILLGSRTHAAGTVVRRLGGHGRPAPTIVVMESVPLPAPPKIKFCGITSLGDAERAVSAGAWAVGLIFWPRSPRRV